VPVTIARLVVEDGGARVVDQRVAPPFALDMQRLEAQVEGGSTDPAAKPARLELKGRVGGTSILALRGTIGSFGGPLRRRVGRPAGLRHPAHEFLPRATGGVGGA
jgi:hypothetical protein